MVCSDIGKRYLSIHVSVGEYRLDEERGLSGAAEDLEREEAVRDKMIKLASAPELREIARVMEETLGYTVIVRAMGYEDILEHFQTLQQGLRDGMPWAQVHKEHRSRRKPLRARH